jgi:hypothetical protein
MVSPRPSLLQRCVFSFFAILAITVCCSAAPAVNGSSVIGPRIPVDDPTGPGWAIGDLDGDRKVDIAQTHQIGRSENGYLYGVELKLSQAGRLDSFTFSSEHSFGVALDVVDVDGDHDLDLVISDWLPGRTIGVWINAGNGTFTEDLHALYLAKEAQSLKSLSIDAPEPAIDCGASRWLSGSLPRALFAIPATRIRKADECTTLDYFSNLHHAQLHLRAPPTSASI